MSVLAHDHGRRLLVLTKRVPWPLNSGGHIRLHHFMRELSQSWQVTCAVMKTPQETVGMPDGVQVISGAEIRVEAGEQDADHRLSVGQRFYGYDQAVAAWLRQRSEAGDFDAVFVNGASNGCYNPAIALPTVWDLCDELILAQWRQVRRNWLYAGSGFRTAAASALHEREACEHADLTLVASEVDAQWLRRCTSRPIAALSNGVDLDYFAATEDTQPSSQHVVFVGSLEFPPNIDAVCWFARKVWPRVLQARSEARLQLVGRRPTEQVLALGEQPGIEIHADVPDVRPYLLGARVVIAPLRMGGGVKNKILEAAAMQRPIVTTPLGLGDLSIPDGDAIVVATRTQAWSEAIYKLLSDHELAVRLGRAARAWVHKNHCWSDIGRTLESHIAEVHARHSQPAIIESRVRSGAVYYHGTHDTGQPRRQ
jgi:glycosyltransferase involved in cell wall biosynthesis